MVNDITREGDKTAAWKRNTKHWARSQSAQDKEKEMKQGNEKMYRNYSQFSKCSIWLEGWTELRYTKLSKVLSNVTGQEDKKMVCDKGELGSVWQRSKP